jgi:beta-1,4-N-acetylglucosaminyltransferase
MHWTELYLGAGLSLCVALVALLVARLYAALGKFKSTGSGTNGVSTLVIFGSGGHTGEMIKLVQELDLSRHSPLYFLLARTDSTSKARILRANSRYAEGVEWLTIHRSREVSDNSFQFHCYESRYRML